MIYSKPCTPWFWLKRMENIGCNLLLTKLLLSTKRFIEAIFISVWMDLSVRTDLSMLIWVAFKVTVHCHLFHSTIKVYIIEIIICRYQIYSKLLISKGLRYYRFNDQLYTIQISYRFLMASVGSSSVLHQYLSFDI